MNRPSATALIALAAGLASGCAGRETAAAAEPISIERIEWTLVSFDGHDLGVLADGQTVTLRFEANRVSGQAPCNHIFGGYQRAADALQFDGLGASKRYCEATQRLENAYLQALRAVDHALVESNRLTLTGNGVSLTFEPSAPR